MIANLTLPQMLIYLEAGKTPALEGSPIRWFESGSEARSFIRKLKAERGE